MFLVQRLGERRFDPQVWRQVGVRLLDSSDGCLRKVAQSTRGAASLRVAVLDPRHVQQLLGHLSRHDARPARSGDQLHRHGATLAANLATRKRIC